MAKAKSRKSTKKKPAKKRAEHHYYPPVTEGQLTAELSEELRDAWRKIRRFGAGLGEQRIYASGKAIMFSRKVCYFFVRPKRSYLEVCLFLPEEVRSPLVRRAQRVSKSRVGHILRLEHADQVEDPLTDWIRRAYETTAASPGSVYRRGYSLPASVTASPGR